MSFRHFSCVVLALIFVGCQSKLNVSSAYKIDAGGIQTLTLDAPRYDQKMTVTVTTDAPVTVNVYLQENANAIEQDLTRTQKSDKVLATWTGDSTGTLEAMVPAKKAAVVRIETTTKPANVTVKVVGK
jgi:hypothetical protein